MSNRNKNLLYSAILIGLMFLVYLYRKQTALPKEIYVQGTTMGTTPYNIKYLDEQQRNFKEEIDKVLKEFNQSLSTYIPDSEISKFNKNDSLTYESHYFYPVLDRSKMVYERTQGAFDPTVMPLVKAWGFGPGKTPQEMTQAKVDSLLQLVGFQYISYDKKTVRKSKNNVELDFSAIAGGYASDLVAELLLEKGIENFMVEIGGEVVCRGTNSKGEIWSIGIENPVVAEEGGKEISSIIRLENKALATSGNYRNFYIKDGKKYAHTLDPKTGYPVEHSLLSATVVAKDCMDADAYATAFMVMGVEKSIDFLKQNTDIQALLIYDEGGKMKIFMTEGLKEYVVK
ncbi:MAG: FAD:protein FMN transferase [Flammeovirgaceae bacterium]